jgi:hypothetical protein
MTDSWQRIGDAALDVTKQLQEPRVLKISIQRLTHEPLIFTVPIAKLEQEPLVLQIKVEAKS